MLALRKVTKRFGPITALDDVSLEIAPGEFQLGVGRLDLGFGFSRDGRVMSPRFESRI